MSFDSRYYFCSITFQPPPYGNIPSLSPNGNYGYAGIVADNDLITITSASVLDPSLFDHFSNGIVATNSILNISNTRFWHMQPEAAYYGLGELGMGVICKGELATRRITSLHLEGLGTGPGVQATFEDCFTGIQAEMSALSVSGAKMTNTRNGIASLMPYVQRVIITNNIIEAEETGIGLFSADFSGYVDIRDNEITVDATISSGNPTFGIGMFNAKLPFNWHTCRVNCNTINLGNAHQGMVISGYSPALASKTLGVNDNVVTISDNSATANGVLFEETGGAFLQHNTVTGSDPSDATPTNAFRFYNSPFNVISQNSSHGTRVGFQFDFDCNSMDNIRGNIIGDHFHGMELRAGGFTGTQAYTGNVWSGYAGSPPYIYEENPSDPGNYIGAWADPSLTIQELSQSQFTVNSSSTLVHFPYYTPVNTGWFFGDAGSNQTFGYNNNCLVFPPLDPELRLGFTDSLIVNDTITSPVYREELRMNAGLNLRDKLVLMLQSEDIPSFFANYLTGYSSTANGKIARYRDTLSVLSNIGSDSIDFMVINDSLLHLRLAELCLIQEENPGDGDALIEQINSKLDSMNIVRINVVDQILTNIENIVYDLMDGVTASHAIEFNLKEAYLSFYNLIMGEDTSQIKSVLGPIANQCIYSGGPGVTIARNLMAAIDSSVIYDDNMLCGSSRIGQVLDQGLNNSYKNVTVYPNPSTGLFNVVIPKELTIQNIVFSVYEFSGCHMYSLKSKGDAENIILDLSGFAPGMYYLRVKTIKKDYYQKLCVIK